MSCYAADRLGMPGRNTRTGAICSACSQCAAATDDGMAIAVFGGAVPAAVFGSGDCPNAPRDCARPKDADRSDLLDLFSTRSCHSFERTTIWRLAFTVVLCSWLR
jgi:hypothetical protein